MLRYSVDLADAHRRSWRTREIRPRPVFWSRFSRGRLAKLAFYVDQLLLFPVVLLIASRRADIVHFADHSDALLAPACPGRTVVVTCHDLFAVRAALGEIPEHRTRPLGRIYQRSVLRGLQRAALVLAVSETTRRDVERLAPSAPTGVLHNPVARKFAAALSDPPTDEAFALVVSGDGWRKRRWLALDAWASIAALQPMRLVVVGPPLDNNELARVRPGTGAIIGEIVQRTGVSDAELAQLYAHAKFLIQASKYEGFCWPVVEANSAGLRALCADEAILREISPNNVFVSSDRWNRTNWAALLPRLVSRLSQEERDVVRDRYSASRFEEVLAEWTTKVMSARRASA